MEMVGKSAQCTSLSFRLYQFLSPWVIVLEEFITLWVLRNSHIPLFHSQFSQLFTFINF